MKRGMKDRGDDFQRQMIIKFEDNKVASVEGDFELSEDFNTPLDEQIYRVQIIKLGIDFPVVIILFFSVFQWQVISLVIGNNDVVQLKNERLSIGIWSALSLRLLEDWAFKAFVKAFSQRFLAKQYY